MGTEEGSSHPTDWAEAHRLLLRVVRVLDKERVFDPDRSDAEAIASIKRALEADEEVAALARCLQGAPADYLEIHLLAPEERERDARLRQAIRERGQAGGQEGLEALLDEKPELAAPPGSVELDQKVALVQEAILEMKPRS